MSTGMNEESILACLDESDLEFLSDDENEENETGLLEAPLNELDNDNDDENFEENETESGVDNEFPPLVDNLIIAPPVLSKAEQEKKYRVENQLTEREDIEWRDDIEKFETTNVPWFRPTPLDIIDLPTPLTFFKKYIPESFYDLAAEKTNIYALQKGKTFSPTSGEEIKTLFGIHILMGNLGYPRVRYYWHPKLKVDLIASNMTLNRYFQLRQNIHFVNNLEDFDPNDKFWKVRPIYKVLRSRCQDLELQTALNVDEQMVPFRGQLSMRQYMKNKPCKYGIKLFLICGKNGQMYDFMLYQGAKNTELDPEYAQFGFGAATVMQLHKRITEPNHQLYFDNYFSTYHLFQWLHNRGCFAAGTIRVNRFHGPPLLSDGEMKRNKERGYLQEVVSKDGQVIVTKWYDNKPVTLASNFVGIGATDTCRRWDKVRKEYINVPRPEVVQLYNENMGGVDTFDFLISLYRIHIKSRKWTLRMIAHALDLSAANAWLEYKKQAALLGVKKNKIMDLLMFRHEIAEGLILAGKPVPSRKRGRPSSSQDEKEEAARACHKGRSETRPIPDVRYDQIGHFPNVDTKKEATRCKNKNCTKKTHIYCLKCNTHLCLMSDRNCFLQFHTN